MNLHRTALLLLSTATATSITWGPRTRSAPVSVDEATIIVTLPATTTATTEGSIAVDGVDTNMTVDGVGSYYENEVVDYYGEGVTVSVDTVESSSSEGSVSVSSYSPATVSSDVSSGVAVTGGVSKTSEFDPYHMFVVNRLSLYLTFVFILCVCRKRKCFLECHCFQRECYRT
jgi:hypothetical protein